MLTHANKRKVRSLEEDLDSVGINAEKFCEQVSRRNGHLQERTSGGVWQGTPPAPNANRDDALEETEELNAADPEDAANQEEAFKVTRKKIKTAGEKLAAKREYRKGRSQKKRAAKMYRKRNKRKIKKRAAKKLAKFGRAGLAKLHKMRRRVVMAHFDEMPTGLESIQEQEGYTQFVEACDNVGLLAMHIAEVFDLVEENDAAIVMSNLSDEAADFAEEIDGIAEDDLTQEQKDIVAEMVSQVAKGCRLYEALGEPTLGEAIELSESTSDESELTEESEGLKLGSWYKDGEKYLFIVGKGLGAQYDFFLVKSGEDAFFKLDNLSRSFVSSAKPERKVPSDVESAVKSHRMYKKQIARMKKQIAKMEDVEQDGYELHEGEKSVVEKFSHKGKNIAIIDYDNGYMSAWLVKKNGDPMKNSDRLPISTPRSKDASVVKKAAMAFMDKF